MEKLKGDGSVVLGVLERVHNPSLWAAEPRGDLWDTRLRSNFRWPLPTPVWAAVTCKTNNQPLHWYLHPQAAAVPGEVLWGVLHPWASFASSPCLSAQPPAPICTLILILNHPADAACKCTEWFKLVFSVCKCSVLWLLRGTWNICSLISDISQNSKQGRLFAAWARVSCCAAGPAWEQLHIPEGKGFFWDGAPAECRVSGS